MNKRSWLYFRKSDRRVVVTLLVIGLLVCTVLEVCQETREKEEKIELPEHWWEKG